ncbi:hypothetical protein [Thioalkalivibrio sp. HK1]|uniref:hypothetical protein n=1 Tax=Thioalkalivibrio sp. HK1 TaxID=1469245 RepID=UPI0012DF8157|nr:hypothetical protein [Thioalkalivibrio sp. HK1]
MRIAVVDPKNENGTIFAMDASGFFEISMRRLAGPKGEGYEARRRFPAGQVMGLSKSAPRID